MTTAGRRQGRTAAATLEASIANSLGLPISAIPPLGVMTVDELVGWFKFARAEQAAGRAPGAWQDWLREHRNG